MQFDRMIDVFSTTPAATDTSAALRSLEGIVAQHLLPMDNGGTN